MTREFERFEVYDLNINLTKKHLYSSKQRKI